MERRRNPRQAVSLDVVVYREGMALTHCRTLDMSQGGVFVPPNCRHFPRNTSVEIEFAVPSGRHTRWYRLPARVVRNAAGGMGLHFDEEDSRTRRVVAELLNGGQGANKGSG